MKRYNITVNGRAYDVAVEELAAGAVAPAPAAAPVAAPAPVAAAPTPAAAPVAAPAPAAAPVSVPEGGTKVTSPMPGNILDVSVSVGDPVERGTVLLILEAMKMENEIVAPVAGTVTSIQVSKGDTVNSNDLLVTIG